MLDYINNFISNTFTTLSIPSIHVSDIIEIIILTFVIYYLAKRIADTRLLVVAKGIIILFAIYGLLSVAQLTVLASLFQWFIILCIICIILACQPEIKKIMESAGSHNYIKSLINLSKKDKKEQLEFSDDTLNAFVDACEQMSKTKTGALIVFELDTPLEDIIATGIKLDAITTKQLLIQIFEKNTPLHDGAIVVKHDRIASATCYLPLSSNLKINKNLGTRHRAGIGVTEQVDCFVLIVSEETGSISWVENGIIHHRVSIKDLKAVLTKLQHRKDNKKITFKPVRTLRLKGIGSVILSLLAALVVWLAMVNIIDPVVTRRFSNVDVQVINNDVITSEETYEIIDGSSISLILEGRRSALDVMKNEDINAYVNLEDMSKVYSIPIEIELLNGYSDYAEIKYKSHNSMKIMIDSLVEKVVEVEYETIGELNDDTYISNISSPDTTVTIKGASNLVSTIDKVVLPVDVTDRKRSFESVVKPEVYDRNGKNITDENISLSITEFRVKVEMLNTKTVPLTVNIAIMETSEFKVLNYEIEKSEISIGSLGDELKEVNSIDITVDISPDIANITTNKLVKTIDINDYIEEGLVVTNSSSKVNINVDIETPVEKEISVDADNITIINTNDKLKYTILDESYTFKVKGFISDIEKLNQNSFKFSIDIEEHEIGTHTIPLGISTAVTDVPYKVIHAPLVEIKIQK